MRALILAAGRGTRFDVKGGGPKCLTKVGRRALIDHYLDALDSLGVPATIVVGHAASDIEKHVSGRRKPPTLVLNPRFREGSIVSLAAGLANIERATEEGEPPADVLLMDGDVAFAPELLKRLVDAPSPDALLVDVGTVFTDEQYMAGLRGDHVVVLRRGPVDGHDAQGEWVGFARLGAATAARFHAEVSAQIADENTTGGYEDALAGLLTDVAFSAVPTGGLPWVEIDFAADLTKARELFAGVAPPPAGTPRPPAKRRPRPSAG